MPERTSIDLQLELLNLKSASYDHITGIPLVNVIYKNIVKLLDQKKKVAIISVSLNNGQELELSLSFEIYDNFLRQLILAIEQTLKRKEIPNYYLVSASQGGEIFYVFIPESDYLQLNRAEVENVKNSIEKGINLKIDTFRTGVDFKNISPSVIVHAKVLESPGACRGERYLSRELEKIKVEIKELSQNLDNLIKYKIERVIERREIDIVFQPIIKLNDRSVFGYEALARGKTEEFTNPEKFLLMAQRNGLLKEVESICVFNALQIFHQACLNNVKLRDKKLFINLSPLSFSVLITDEFTESINAFGFKPDQIVIELTEKFAAVEPIENREYYDFIKRISKLVGFEIAVDDVGTGYSTLERIAELNPHYIKYDRVLAKNVHKDPVKQELLKTILDFSRKINSHLIVEGVDNTDDFEFLRKLRVEFIQGYIFSRPLKLTK